MVEVTNIYDYLCNVCINIMTYLSHETGMSYGLINILLFVILGPLSTLFFMGSTLTATFVKNANTKKILTSIFVVLGLLCVCSILGLVGYGFLTMPC